MKNQNKNINELISETESINKDIIKAARAWADPELTPKELIPLGEKVQELHNAVDDLIKYIKLRNNIQ